MICVFLLQKQSAQLPHPRLTFIEIDKFPTPPASAKAKAQPEPERVRDRIVQTTEGELVKKAPQDAFLGERTQQVEEQTIGRRHETAMGHVAAKPAPLRPEVEPHPAQKAERQQKGQELPPVSQFGLEIIPHAHEAKQQADEQRSERPEPRWADQSGSPEDYVPGIREADRTALNTKEFVFYSYYQRIRSRLDREWIPILREKLVRLYRTGRQLASDMDHTTKVLVVMNDRGEIVRIEIVNESGTRDLDDAAIKAFNEAGPFPNPPHGIVDINHEIHIPWEFILKT